MAGASLFPFGRPYRTCIGTRWCDTGRELVEIHDIVEVEVTGDYRLRVTFDDGAVRDLSLEGRLDGPVFEPLKDPELFAQASIDRESGTVTWPTGADLDPITIYEGESDPRGESRMF
jgi:Protein of unknown function (DUF2442)